MNIEDVEFVQLNLEEESEETPELQNEDYKEDFFEKFKMTEDSIFSNVCLLVLSGTLLRKRYTGSSFFLTF